MAGIVNYLKYYKEKCF
ncbi:hypothetical protein [Escherichia coli]|nr:hypothetical protein [Escherichia coli]